MSSLKYFALLLTLFFIFGCSTSKEKKKEVIIPDKITMLFITQPNCSSCKKLEEVMQLEKPKQLIENYFEIKKVYLGEKIPDNLIPPNGTPTVYFLGSNDEVLVEPIIGEKDETELMEFLNDALYEFKNTYGVDIQKLKKKEDINETNISQTNA